jgi:hypothetical protein
MTVEELPAPLIVMFEPAVVPTWSSPAVRLNVPAGTAIVNGPPAAPVQPPTSVFVFAVLGASRSEQPEPTTPSSSTVVLTVIVLAANAG